MHMAASALCWLILRDVLFCIINAEDDGDNMSKVASSSETASTSKTPRSKARVMSRKTTKLSESLAEGDEISAARTSRTNENRLPTSMSKRTQVSGHRLHKIITTTCHFIRGFIEVGIVLLVYFLIVQIFIPYKYKMTCPVILT